MRSISARDLRHQASFHVRSTSRQALPWTLSRLPPSWRHYLIHSLERIGRPQTLEIGRLHPNEAGCLVESHVVGRPATALLPPTSPGAHEVGRRWDELRVHHLRDVVVDTETGYVFHRGMVVAQSSNGFRNAADGVFVSNALARAARPEPANDPSRPIAPLGAVWNYYHFLIDALPRILHIRSVEPRAVAVFAGPLPGFVPDIMRTLGIDYEVRVPGAFTSDSTWICDPSMYNWPHPENLAALSSAARTALVPREPAAPTHVYVSRAGSSRSLHEEHVLEERLAALGFTPLRLETLTWAEQVAHFQAADVVIGGHGAGLGNVVFLRPGARVVEFTAGAWWTPSFRNISGICGHAYDLVTIPSYDDHRDGTARDAVERLLPLIDPPAAT